MSHHYSRVPEIQDVLIRRRQTLASWCTEMGVASYDEFVAKCAEMGIATPTRASYDEAFPVPAPVKSTKVDAIKAVIDSVHDAAEKDVTRSLTPTEREEAEAALRPRKPRKKKPDDAQAEQPITGGVIPDEDVDDDGGTVALYGGPPDWAREQWSKENDKKKGNDK